METEFRLAFGVPLRSFWAATEDVGATVVAPDVGPYMRLIDQAEARIVDASGHPVAIGELVVSSPTTSPGYWEDSGVVPLPGGEFWTGDLVREHAPGVLMYVGRQKDLIIRGGSNISPTEVEEAIRAHPAVVDVGVAGVPDSVLGERVGAVLVLESSLAGTAESSDVLAWLSVRLAAHKVPERVVIVDRVPRTALTKVDRKAVVEVLVAAGAGKARS